jgi:hypothetical protein
MCVGGSDSFGGNYYMRYNRLRIAYPGIYNLKTTNGYTGTSWDWVYTSNYGGGWGKLSRDSSASLWYINLRDAQVWNDNNSLELCMRARWSLRFAIGGSTAGAGFQAAGWQNVRCTDMEMFGCANYDGELQ